MGRKVIAVIDWAAAGLLKENIRFLKQVGGEGKVRPKEWRTRSAKYRSLTLWEDGSCELQGFSTAAAVKRLGGVIVRRTARKARLGQRG